MRIPPGRLFWADLLIFGRKAVRCSQTLRSGAGFFALCVAAGAAILPALPVQGQNAPLSTSVPFKTDPNAQMLLQADELVYDDDSKTVMATGHVQIFYNGYNVVANKVAYNKATRRLNATGDVRIKDPTGNVYYSDQADLTDNFSDGFVRTLRLERSDNTHLAADSAERSGGNLTVFNRGVYTACEPCKKHPEKPPLWQVKAARVISNQKEQTIYFEDATVEFFGLPVAYLPYFWTPDATVKRKSGFLNPNFYYNKRVGTGISTPYYFALSPFYDITYTPTFITPQGIHNDVLWRHSLPNGSYDLRLTGIFQFDPDRVGVGYPDLLDPRIDAGAKDFRGSVQSKGKFLITDKWSVGWDVAFDSDAKYLKDYGYIDLGQTERISTVYLQGKGERSFFDARSYYFRSLVDLNTDPRERQGYQPIVAPVVDYNTAMADKYLGGEFRIDGNVTNITRDEQLTYQVPSTGKYLTPGFAGDYTRVSLQASWRKTYTDSIGQRFTPFASLRGDVYRFGVEGGDASINTLTNPTNVALASQPISSIIPSLLASEDDVRFRGMPTAGFDYRYPFVATSGSITHLFEPIAQIVVRPNETNIGEIPNEDAHSLVYDDTNLFEVDKFSGYDRLEGGTRLNAGAQYTIQDTSGFKASALFGQSFQIAGLNSFSQGLVDINGTGLESGLQNDDSDYVARLYVQPSKYGDISARARFDQKDWTLERFELESRLFYGPFALSTAYVRRAAQPDLGIETNLEEVNSEISYALSDQWSVYAGGRYSLQNASNDPGFVSDKLGVKYTDECFTVSLDYSTYYQNYGDIEAQRQIMVRFNLRTLGDGQFETKVGNSN